MPAMTLSEYLKANGPGAGSALAAKLGVYEASLSKWRTGRAMPRPAMMAAIERATGGAVTANDMHKARMARLNEPVS